MRKLLHRLFGGLRGFDAADGGRRWAGAKDIGALKASILAGATTAGPVRQARSGLLTPSPR